eukprot:jgi/Ulvmu1/8100/UM004_0339.1
MGVFSFGFNMRECKLACIQAINRIKIYRNKQIAEEATCKRTVGEYLSGGKLEMGLMRVEQVIRVQNTLKALEILEVFLEMVRTRMEYLAKQKYIPDEMRTSILSIAYAASRMPDIPELAGIRKQFESRFGREAFAEVSMADPSQAGVQEKLLNYLAVEPPRDWVKLKVAMDIIEQQQIECTEEELKRVLGMSDDLPPAKAGHEQFVPFIPTAVDPTAHVPSQITDPVQINEFGNPAPSLHPEQPAPVPPQQPVGHAAQQPIPEHKTVAPTDVAAIPSTSAQVPSQGLPEPAAAAAAPAPGYMEAVNAALRGATPGRKPVLDSANPGPEGYMGAAVQGSVGSANSIPAVPPAAAQVQASDLLFPDVKWMDSPPPPQPPADGGIASLADLPPAPSHDPNMPSAPRFSHAGAVYDPEQSEEGSVHDDLMERFKRLQQ